jgi:hypothetical protein
MTNEINDTEETSTREKLAGAAQVLIGEIESLGGVITGDPLTSAEGDFNIQVGTLHEDSSEALSETESRKTAPIENTPESSPEQE